MAKYIIRLDDACPMMDWTKWKKMELLLDKYNVRPIVGVIPDNKDKDFQYIPQGDFWNLCRTWQAKGWIIAQHGFSHVISPCGKQKFYQMTYECRSEFAGVPYEEQRKKIEDGYEILKSHNVIPQAFFAPAHTYDKNTVAAIVSFGNRYKFISDGYALKPFKKDGAIFVPSIFDSPKKVWGNVIMTFVYHPNNMQNMAFQKLEKFLQENHEDMVSAADVISSATIQARQGVVGKAIEIGMLAMRQIRFNILHSKLKRY